MRAALKDRFWAKVRKGPGCWEWTAATRNGYGAIGEGRKVRYAHRLALEWTLGRPLLPGMDAMHACDNRKCVSPAHLSEGTRRDNVQDMLRKGRENRRGMPGEAHPRALLSAVQVLEIRIACARGERGKTIGARYGVSPVTVSAIKLRRLWPHI